MNVQGQTLSGGSMHGVGVPVPLEPRPIRERPHRRGLDWPAPTGPDPDAVARLAASKRKPKRLIEFDVDKAAKAYTDGATLAELSASIEAETGRPVSAETIRKRLLGAGVTMRPKASGWGTTTSPEEVS